MKKWFNNTPRLMQAILLLVPVLNWIIELLVRWDHYGHKKTFFSLLIAIIVTVFGLVFGWLDFIWVILFKHLLFAK